MGVGEGDIVVGGYVSVGESECEVNMACKSSSQKNQKQEFQYSSFPLNSDPEKL